MKVTVRRKDVSSGSNFVSPFAAITTELRDVPAFCISYTTEVSGQGIKLDYLSHAQVMINSNTNRTKNNQYKK